MKDAISGPYSSSAESRSRPVSSGLMHEKLRKINDEFKARSCVGSGFVFNKNVRLESPKSFFKRDEGRNASESSVKSLGINLYRPTVEMNRISPSKNAAVDLKSSYVQSVVESSMFNRDRKDSLHSTSSRSVFASPSNTSQSQSVKSFCLQSAHAGRTQSPAPAPINVMYMRPTRPQMQEEADSDIPVLYAPGTRLTTYPKIKISNTVLNYEGSDETTTYYISIESNVSWTVCKSIKDIVCLAPNIPYTTPAGAMSPQDRKIRDSVIQAMLNARLDRQLQAFILTGISEETAFRSSYLLMNNGGWRAYLFKFVGKALICYEKSKVLKIFLLAGCDVSPVGTEGFRLRKAGEGIELYATCERERDAWMVDVREYICRL